jgi:hypothetical protein
LNLSGSQDFDPLKVTDLIASEFISFRNISVVPVNLTLAELQRQGKNAVETGPDAVRLAQALGADATIVTAITEYNPYSPPVVGMIMQWYSAQAGAACAGRGAMEPHAAADQRTVELSDGDAVAPRWQVQRVFNAADEETREEVRSYAAERDGHDSPFGWKKFCQSQELYVRYCGWSLIRTMVRLDSNDRVVAEPHEAES